MKNAAIALVFSVLAAPLFGVPVAVTYDENGRVSPQEAEAVISNACSAIVQVDLANARAEILQEVASVANATLDSVSALLTEHSDYTLLDLYAIGVEDAKSSSATATEGRIDIVDIGVDKTSTPGSTLVTLTWQYTTGSFTSPQIIAAASITNGNVFASIPQTEPVQIEWGTNSAYRATATVDNATFGANAFFKVEATPDAPVDDGQVFDTFSDGTDYVLDLIPTNRYRIRIISGRITTVQYMGPASL